MKVARPVLKLIESFEKLPGIGSKTAQRLTYYLLHVPQSELDGFGSALMELKRGTVMCSECLNISETDPCDVCSDLGRDKSIICVVEQPLDVFAFDRTGKFKGVYHVLHGAISPLNNIGPDEIHIEELLKRVKAGGIKEVILAMNVSMEGEATAMFIAKQLQASVKVTRLAHGLPQGSDIEYADDLTLSRALEGRREY